VRLSQDYPLRGALALLAVGVPGAAHAAAAQSSPPLLTISPSISVRYDTNVARASDEIARLRGIKPHDWHVTPNLNIDLEKPVGRQVLYLDGDVGYDFYARNHQLNRGRILLNGGARLKFSRCTGTVYGSFAVRQTDVAELIDQEAAGNTEHVSAVGANARCELASGLAPFAGVSRTWVTNNSEIRRLADYTMNEANGGIAYSRPVLGELAIVASVKDAHYPHRGDTLLTDHFHVFSIGGRYSRDIGSRLQGSVGINRTTVDSGAGFPKFTGLTSDVSLTAKASDNIQAHFQWVRDVQPVNVGFGAFNIDSRLSGDVDYGFSPRLTLTAGAGLIHRHIEGELPIFGPELQRERRVFEYLRLTYTRSERTSLALDVRHESRTADPSAFDYRSTSVGLTLRTRF
jgi:hypothetical protein